MAVNLRRRVSEVLNSPRLVYYAVRGEPEKVQPPEVDGEGNIVITPFIELKAQILNAVLPAAEAAWNAAGISPTRSPSFCRIYVAVSVSGIFRVARTVAFQTVVEDLNSGDPLTANAAYMFDVEWRTGDSLNFRYSVTGGTIIILRADEVS